MTFEYDLLLAILIFWGGLWYVVSPLVSKETGAVSAGPEERRRSLDDLRMRKEEIFLTLKDLELDHRMEKISDVEYRRLFEETFAQAAEVAGAIDAPPIPTKGENSPYHG